MGETGNLDDAATVDICTEITRGTGKWLWFVEAHTQRRQPEAESQGTRKAAASSPRTE